MPTTRTRKPPTRTVRLIDVGTALSLIITQTEGRRTTTDVYDLRSFPSQVGGHGFTLTKVEGKDRLGDTYHVLLAGELSSCECRGFLSHNHCRHVESLAALQAAGKL